MATRRHVWTKAGVNKNSYISYQKPMSRYTQIVYQLVFATKYRLPTLQKSVRPRIFAYMSTVLLNKKCHSYIVNGVEDHVHLIFSLHPTVALSDLVRDVKLSARDLIKENDLLPEWGGWQKGYGAFTYDQTAVPNLVNYVKRQEEHHADQTFEVEFKRLLDRHDVSYDEAWLFEE